VESGELGVEQLFTAAFHRNTNFCKKVDFESIAKIAISPLSKLHSKKKGRFLK